MSLSSQLVSLQTPPAAFAEPSKRQAESTTRSSVFTAMTVGVNDGEFYSKEVGDLRINADTHVAPLQYCAWKDELPDIRSSPTWGGEVNIDFGDAGTYVTEAELHFVLEASTGTTTNQQYATYLAERLIGEEYKIKFQNETVRRQNVDGMHFKRRLEESLLSNKAAAARTACGALNQSLDSKVHVWCKIDMGFTKDKPFVGLAHAEDMRLTFEMPRLADVVNAADASDAYAVPADSDVEVSSVFLRVKYSDHPSAHRFMAANHILTEGAEYHVSTIEKNMEKSNDLGSSSAASIAAASTAELTGEVALRLIHPSSYLIMVLRYQDDLKAAVANNGSTSLIGANSAADRFISLPPVRWSLRENGQRVYPEVSWQYASTTRHAELFPSEVNQPIAVQSFTEHPTVADDHTVGHLTTNNMTQPTIQMTYVKAIEDPAAATPSFPELTLQGRQGGSGSATATQLAGNVAVPVQLDVFSVTPNFLIKDAGRIYPGWE